MSASRGERLLVVLLSATPAPFLGGEHCPDRVKERLIRGAVSPGDMRISRGEFSVQVIYQGQGKVNARVLQTPCNGLLQQGRALL